ncbi:MAG: DUF456 domain-containing protein [Halomonadaceae bacterium]|nr:MAG: DUF456 domain-containing protein [Halomonadaceae bacterium]
MTTLLIWLIALLFIAIGLAGLVFPALPGPLLLFAGLWMAAWAEGFVFVGLYTLIILGVLAGLASLADFVAGALGARRSGASSRSVWGATIGAVIGLFFGLPGLLLGPFIGAVIGELSQQWNLAAAGRAGWGATIGMALGIAAKLAFGITMVGLFLGVRFL